MTKRNSGPTIRTISSVDVAWAALGDAGVQRVLLGATRSDGSPLMMGVSHVRSTLTSPLIQHDTAEVAYVLGGVGWMVTDSAEHPFMLGDAILIEVGCWHAIRAGSEPVDMLFVFPTPVAPITRVHPSSLQ